MASEPRPPADIGYFQNITNVGWFSSRYWVFNPAHFGLLVDTVAQGHRLLHPLGTIVAPTNDGRSDILIQTKQDARDWVNNHMYWAFLDARPNGIGDGPPPHPEAPLTGRVSWAPGFAVGRYFIENPTINDLLVIFRDNDDVIFTCSLTRPITKEKLLAAFCFDMTEDLAGA